VITGVAALMAIPLGVLAAVYLNEYGRQNRLAKVIRFMADVMTGVPSIVMGLFVATIWVSAGLHYGYSGFAGSLALGALMLPIVIRSCEEMLKLVPNDLRQASDALGARRWRTVLSVVIPASLPGIVSGAMLAVARAAGETAPLLLTIGFANQIAANPLHGPNNTLSQVIWFNALVAEDAVDLPVGRDRARVHHPNVTLRWDLLELFGIDRHCALLVRRAMRVARRTNAPDSPSARGRRAGECSAHGAIPSEVRRNREPLGPPGRLSVCCRKDQAIACTGETRRAGRTNANRTNRACGP
jgi:ABC-type molybdate transport system permease subunit